MTKIATVVELSSCMGEIQVLAPFVATWRAERSIDLECRPSLARRVDTGNQHIDQAWVDIQCYALTIWLERNHNTRSQTQVKLKMASLTHAKRE